MLAAHFTALEASLLSAGRERSAVVVCAPDYPFGKSGASLCSTCQWLFPKSPVTDSFQCALRVGWETREGAPRDIPLPAEDGGGG